MRDVMAASQGRVGEVRVVFAGTPQAAVPSLNALMASRHEVCAVLTRPDAPSGRGRRLEPSPVAQRADELELEILKPDTPSDGEFMEHLDRLAPDCVPIVAYGALIGRQALEIPPRGWINLHFSVLPSWRGAAPIQRSIMSGDEVTGASVFQVVEELDAGPVYGTITEQIRSDDTAAALQTRLADAGSQLLVDVLDHVEDGTVTAVPQPAEGVSYAAKITTSDARVDWNHPAFAVDRQIRGCTPVPGAWTTLGEDRLKIGPVTVEDTCELRPGEVRIAKDAVAVGTATADVILSTVQAPGKRSMRAADWARGLSSERGHKLH